jgi:hypothetical protein
LFLIAGCGRIAFDPHRIGGVGDGGGSGGDGPRNPDGPPDAPCTWSAFSVPVQLPAIVQSTSDDWSPGPMLGGSVVYFHSFRTTSSSVIWRAQLLPVAQAAVRETELDLATANVLDPSLPDDGLEMFVDSDATGMRKIYSATRTDTSQPFTMPTQVASLNASGADDQNPTITGDGLRIIFESSRAGVTTLWEASRPDRTSPFGMAVRHAELEVASNTGRLDRGATLTPNGLDIFFAAPPGGVGQDIFTAHRPTLGQPFGTPVRVAELSSAQEDEYPKMSADASTLWFTYQGDNSGAGDTQLWTATRSCM